jgi:hypothetical protein
LGSEALNLGNYESIYNLVVPTTSQNSKSALL